MKVKKQFWLEKEQAKEIERGAKALKISESEYLRRLLMEKK